MHGWTELSNYALNLGAAGGVRVEYPQYQKWIVLSGPSRNFRTRQVVTIHEGKPSCTCGEWSKGYACWHVAYVCHFYGIQVPT